jgi:hypothetical protein
LLRLDTSSLLIATLLTLPHALVGISLAQDNASDPASNQPERIALTDPPEGDWDYTLMGEFVGVIETDKEEFSPLGLQLRPLGPSNFEAIQFIGGLPGQEGFHADGSLQLIGRRYDQYMILTGGPWVIIVETDHCLILDRFGKSLGRLERIERGSPTMGARPPKEAVVLFDGTHVDQFTNGKMTADGLLMAGADVLPMFQDFDLHVEFRLPYMPNSDGQSRGNSGCYLQSRYEVQILDSFAQNPQFNGAASLYRQRPPDLNMSLPPLVWQTYDISFTAPRWAADGNKIRNARITVWHNGVKVQDDVEIVNKTGAGRQEEPSLLPLRFQDHRDPVVFRNLWIIDRGLTGGLPFPVLSPTPEQIEAERLEAERLEAERLAAEKLEAAKTPEVTPPSVEPEAVDSDASEEPAANANKAANQEGSQPNG